MRPPVFGSPVAHKLEINHNNKLCAKQLRCETRLLFLCPKDSGAEVLEIQGGWADTENFVIAEGDETASLTLTLVAGNYEFGMRIGGSGDRKSVV